MDHDADRFCGARRSWLLPQNENVRLAVSGVHQMWHGLGPAPGRNGPIHIMGADKRVPRDPSKMEV
ncbi:hypothetical protein BRAS3843_1270004 [Bradyrhizobium sp. STM 3843]|nr:hypothetical protein BRAS3843_1270004 [Bradyrhizobium sp. STM 3843]